MSWKDNVKQVVPYVPGEQPQFTDMIKLNTNENPYPPSPRVAEVLSGINSNKLKLYPKPDAKELVDAIAEVEGVDQSQVFVGVGSDDVLGMAFLTFFNGEKPVFFPDITYSFYPVWAELFGIKYEKQPLDENFRIQKEAYYKPNGGIVLANPNAPTSIGEPMNFIEDIVCHNPNSVVIVDEAYVDFGGETCLPLVKKYDNVLVVRTFSKSRSMAGMRIGYAIGTPELIGYMMAVRNSYNSYTMNYPSILCGTEAMLDTEYFNLTREKIMQTRENAVEELTRLGFTVLPSQTNFLFATHKEKSAKEIFEKLREKHIYVRYFNAPRIDNYLRITIGTDREMGKFYNALSDILGA